MDKKVTSAKTRNLRKVKSKKRISFYVQEGEYSKYRGLLEEIRIWSDRWVSMLTLVANFIVPLSFAVALVALYQQNESGKQQFALMEAQISTLKQQIRNDRKILIEMRAQERRRISQNSRNTAVKTLEMRSNTLYNEFFRIQEEFPFESASSEDLVELDRSLNFYKHHFDAVWNNIVECAEPYCDTFRVLHSYTNTDLCTVANEDANRYENILNRRFSGSEKTIISEYIGESKLGLALCWCPDDWSGAGVEQNRFCTKPWFFGHD